MTTQNKLFSFVDIDRSRKVRWLLCELGLPFEEHRLDWDKGEHLTPSYREISPMGRVPGIDINGTRMFESSAICTFLADQYPEKNLAPRVDSPERAEYLSWLFFGATTLENEVLEVMRARKNPDDANRFSEAQKKLNHTLSLLDETLVSKEYLCGSKFTAADLVAGYPLAIANEAGILGDFAGVRRYLGLLMDRPAAKRSKFMNAKIGN